MTPVKATVVIADDHGVVRRGVRAILDSEPDLEVVGEAADGAEAVVLVRDRAPDLAVLDVAMPRMTGLQATREITRRHPGTRVLVLSMHDDEQYLFEALRSGASGYVLKSGVDRDLVHACRAALRGAPFLYPDAVAALVRDHLQDGVSPPEELLTPRELEVVKLIAEAQTNDQIAAALVISPKTVERHRANILEKLGMHDRVELTRYAIRRGLVQP